MKVRRILLVCVFALVFVLALAACDLNDVVQTHNHTVVVDDSVDATCKDTGLTEGSHCSECGEILMAQSVVPLKAHTYDDKYDAFCNVCGYEREAECAHVELETIPGKPATCKVEGLTDGKKCAKCGEIIIAQTIIPKIENHNFINNVCERCGEMQESVGLAYKVIDDNTCYISGIGSCTDLDIKIPTYIDGYKVTGIGDSAFWYCSSLTSVVIPDSVTSIGDEAFRSCSSLTSIVIPDGITSIGYGAFWGCSSLAYNEYDNAYYLGNNFNPYLVLIKAKDLTITSCNINSETRFIHSEAFSYCSSLTSIVIPDSVTSIGEAAFYWCANLITIDLGDGLISIGVLAFSECSSLMNVEFPDSLTTIGNNAFLNCRSLTSIVIPDSVTSIDYHAFMCCTGLTNVIIGNGVDSIADGVFAWCSSLTSITIPNSVTSIGGCAFSYCYSLTSIVIPDSVTSIGEQAFCGCSSLTSIAIPNSVTSIGNSAFAYCDSLTSILIPDSVTSIGAGAFGNCSSLTSVTIGNSVTSIGDDAFEGCYKLVEVINKSSLELIAGSLDHGEVAYYAKEVHDGTTKIVNQNDYLFYTYNGINYFLGYIGADNELILPITYNGQNYEIYMYAFRGCDSLTSIVIPDSVTSIGTYAFYECDSLTSIVIPDSVTSIGDSAFSNCSSLTSVTIGNGVTSIGSYAFAYCRSLTSITYTGTAQQWASVTKGASWKHRVPATVVVCSDKTVTL